MGYTLKIGEAELLYDEDMVRVGCRVLVDENSPAHGDPTDGESQRWPSYSTWADSMRTLGMVDVMFNRRSGGAGTFEWNGVSRGPLIECHPGCVPITREHVEYVEAKLREYMEKFPDHRPEYPPLKEGVVPAIEGTKLFREEDYVDDPIYDAALVRGEWLAWWLRYALDNCKQPVFLNS